MTICYPDLRFTFPMPKLQPNQELHTFSIELNPKVSCKILLEDRERYRCMAYRTLYLFKHFTIYVCIISRYSWRPILFENSHFGTEIEISSSNSVGTSLFYEFAVTFRWIG